MSLPKRITSNPKLLIYVLFIVAHVALLNINVAEWGDSYRILRAAEFVRQGSYPLDEKRPPLLPLILATHPAQVDPVFYGRIIVFFISLGSLIIFDKLASLFIKQQGYHALAMVLYIFNPVVLYWSLRVMTDVLFGFFVLLVFYLFMLYRQKRSLVTLAGLAVCCGLAILTRFEGYILTSAIGLGLVFDAKILVSLKQNFKHIFVFGVSFLAVWVPYLLFRNPLHSTYFEEPASRTYNLTTVWTYVVSLVFVMGSLTAPFLFFKNFKPLKTLLRQNIGIASFLAIELVLVLVWPAAIPRLFLPIIPFLAIFLSLAIQQFFNSPEPKTANLRKARIFSAVFLLASVAFYAGSQYVLKLQFLIPIKLSFVMILALQLAAGYFLLAKKFTAFIVLTLATLLLWSLSIVWLHKNIYSAIKAAAIYAETNLSGTIVYNDLSSTADWYITVEGTDKLRGVFYNFQNTRDVKLATLHNLNATYLILTNEEHSPSMQFNINKLGYLAELKSFQYNVGDAVFYAEVVKVVE
jgi:hypothetical protein